MPIQVRFIPETKTLTEESAKQWVKSAGFQIPPGLGDQTLEAMLEKTQTYGFMQATEFLRHLELVHQFGRMHGDHPPNALSVVDDHLPESSRVPDWLVIRNPFPCRLNSHMKNFSYPKYSTAKYTVGSFQVFVVWPLPFKAPAPNRLGWLPQMEFAAIPGQIDPRQLFQQVRFAYNATDGTRVELAFGP